MRHSSSKNPVIRLSDPMSDCWAPPKPEDLMGQSQLIFEGCQHSPLSVPGIWAGQGSTDQGVIANFHFQAISPLSRFPGPLRVRAAALVASSGEGCLLVEGEVQTLSQGDIVTGQLCFTSQHAGLHTMQVVFEYPDLPPYPAQRTFQITLLLTAEDAPTSFDLLSSRRGDPQAQGAGSLEWRPSIGARHYEVLARYIPTMGGAGHVVTLGRVEGSETTLDLNGLSLPSGTYDWFVVARNGHGSATSNQNGRFTLHPR